MAQHYEIIVVKEGGDTPKHYFINKLGFSILRFLLIVIVVVGTVLFFASGYLFQRVVAYNYVIKKNDSLKIVAGQVKELKDNYGRLLEDVAYFQMVSQIPHRNVKPSRQPLEYESLPVVEEKSPTKVMGNALIPNSIPVAGMVTKEYEENVDKRHRGIDFAAVSGTPIVATASGVVKKVSLDEYLGNVITLVHSEGYSTLYAHCSQITVEEGKEVKQGEVIAFVGNSGKSSGPHLHYEVMRLGKNQNPRKYF